MDVSRFPEFFKSVVETVAANGPVALLILLLFILLGGVYLFRQQILQNRFARIGFAVLSVVLGALLIVLVYRVFDTYIRTFDRQSMVVIKGSIRYPALDKERGDLLFNIVGPNRAGAGDREDRFYAYDNDTTEKRILVIAKPERIRLAISNRPLFRACTEDSPALGSRSTNYQTVYTINLPASAYIQPVNPSSGLVIYQIDFDYRTRRDRDVLKISGLEGIDPKKITYDVRHLPEGECLDKPISELIELASDEINGPVLAPMRQLVDLLGEALIAPSRAQDKAGTPDENAIDLLGARDPSLAGKARNTISHAPADYIPAIADVLRSTSAADADRQTDALIALKGVSKAPALPLQTIEDILRLSYAPSADLRLAARNYLADPAILKDDVVKVASAYYTKHRDELKVRDPESFLLLALTMREIYYVAGVNKIVDYTGNWGQRARSPVAIDASLAYFDSGIAIIKDVPASNAVPYAKSYYGKALALRSRVTVNAAVAKFGPGATSKEIDGEIYNLVKQSAPLPFTEAERSQFIGTLDAFLTLVSGREKDYFWPAHIEKMKECRRAQTYDCIR